jgi:D,D-heptose 1,7-bisphosphate phosphatase
MQKDIKDLIILAGGKGTRLRKYTKNKPKPLVKIGRSSILEKIINQLSKYQFRKIFIIAGYKSDLIYRKFHNKYINFNQIICLNEKEAMGTGGYIQKNIKKFTPSFYVVNADSFCDFNFIEFEKIKLGTSLGKIVLTKCKNYTKNKKLNNLNINKNKIIIEAKNNKLMNAGIYLLKKKCFMRKFNKNYISLETDIILPLIKNKKICGYLNDGFFIDIGTPANFLKAQSEFEKNLVKPAIFLDRDGTINEDYGYVHNFKDFKLKRNILRTLKYLHNKKIYFFIVTNQAGIAKRKFTLDDFNKFQIQFKKFFSKYNIYFDYVAFCPFHENALDLKYKKKTNYRKPGNLMIKNILKHYYVDLKNSIFIGDSKKDYLCAKKSNIKFLYYSKKIFHQIKKYY